MPSSARSPSRPPSTATRNDLARLRRAIEVHLSGDSSELKLRSVRVPMGVYEQRETGAFMARVCLPGGVLTGAQLVSLASVAERHGSGRLHVTTRQDVQVHDLALADVLPALEQLSAAGLSTRGGGGNTVRNVTCCGRAGICPDELFDVTPWTKTLQSALTRDIGLGMLPRKFKLAISGCDRDCAGATVADLGLVAAERDGVFGFRVLVGGGLGSGSRLADELYDFVPLARAVDIARAVRDLFDRYGDRKDKHRARLRFVLRKMGIARFRRLVTEQLEGGAAAGSLPEPGSAEVLPTELVPLESAEAPSEWLRRSVGPQKQPGRHEILLALPLGDLDGTTARGLGRLLAAHPGWELRSTVRQNLALRGVGRGEVGDTYDELARLGLAGSTAPILRDLVACAGAATCKLGLCRSRGAALAIAEHLEHGPLDLDALGELRIAISGCPNSCSRHSVADIGLFGAARRVDGRLVPHYQLRLGGRLGVGQARLATGSWIVPARRAPHFIEGLLRAYTAFGVEQGFQAFCVAAGPQAADALASSLGTVPGRSEDEAFHVDWGSCAPFSLAGRGPGECGAGVIDLVDVDLASSREALEAGRWLDAAVLAARALLVTRGEEPATSREALVQFERHFVETGLVGRPIGALLGRALQALQSSDRSSSAVLGSHDAETLLGTVSSLYESMDARLEFSPVTGTVPSASDEPLVQSDAFRDFRGVVCPLNWAKTRMVLTRLAPGQVLALLLDDEGARKVPESAGREGHAVMSVARQERDWLVHIRKAAKPAGGRV